MLKAGFSLFTFDFAGSGMSEGKYVSLGYKEAYDIKAVIEYLRCSNRVSSITLWGRSMGAAAVLRYAARYSGVNCLVLDSPFSTLQRTIADLANKYRYIPRIFIDMMRR